jgi:putative membrane protein (TIGR04086 family)
MLQMITYFKIFGKVILYLLIILFLLTLLNNFNIINYSLFSYLKFILLLSLMFVGGYIKGKNSISKGWLEGIKFSLFIVVLLTIFNYLAYDIKINSKIFMYFLIIMVVTTLGSMIGISKRKETS